MCVARQIHFSEADVYRVHKICLNIFFKKKPNTTKIQFKLLLKNLGMVMDLTETQRLFRIHVEFFFFFRDKCTFLCKRILWASRFLYKQYFKCT